MRVRWKLWLRLRALHVPGMRGHVRRVCLRPELHPPRGQWSGRRLRVLRELQLCVRGLHMPGVWRHLRRVCLRPELHPSRGQWNGRRLRLQRELQLPLQSGRLHLPRVRR